MQNGLLFEETTAVTSYRVKEAFEYLIQAIYCFRRAVGDEPSEFNLLDNMSTQEKRCCQSRTET